MQLVDESASNMTDDQILVNAMTDTDNQPLTDEEITRFVQLSSIPGNSILERLQNLKKRAAKKSLTVRYDADLVDYYRAKGKGYQQAMNDALRVCMEAEKGMRT